MDPTIDSSPLKRFATFWLGLATFAAFGALAFIAYKVAGGGKDPAYEAQATERQAVVDAAVAKQDEKLAASPVDLAAAVSSLSGRKATASEKPAPGTKAFDEWMAAQAAAAAKPDPENGGEPAVEGFQITVEALPGGVMKFKQTELTVEAGEKVALTFVNPDVMQHNFLLLKPGTKDAVGALADAMAASADGPTKHYIPESDDILANTKLVDPLGGRETIGFTAPTEPGDYPYICTFPGHWRIMQGVLKVVPKGEGKPAATDAPAADSATKIKLEAMPGGVMKFKQAELTVKAGVEVELTFVNPDVLQHNFLLVKPGTKEKVGALADAMLTDPDAMKKGYVPASDDILAHTGLVDPAQSETIKFTAPSEPGDYPYICTFPGHWRLMFGVLKVTP